MKILDKLINADSVINEKIPLLIEVFVSYYGEAERERIERVFNNAIICGYVSPNIYRHYIEREKRDTFLRIFSKKLGIDNINDANHLEQTLKAFYTNLDEEYEIGINEIIVNYLKSKGFPNTIENRESIKRKFIELRQSYEDTKKTYDEVYEREIKPHEVCSKELPIIRKKILAKHRLLFLESLDENHLLPPVYNELLQSNDEESIISVSEELLDYLCYFCNPDNEKLDETQREYYPALFDFERVNFFKKMGYDLGNEYSQYEKDERVLSVWPSEETAEKMLNLYNELDRNAKDEFVRSIAYLNGVIDKIDNIGFLADSNYADMILDKAATVSPNFVKDGESLELKPILFFSIPLNEAAIDCTLLHELNHLYELELLKSNDGKYKIVCGWDNPEEYVSEDKLLMPSKDIDGEYRLSNEMTNELFAQDLSKQMHNMGVSIFSDKSVDSSMSHYEEMIRPFVFPFYNDFHQDIIDSRKNGNIDLLYDKLGRENIIEYRDLINNFCSMPESQHDEIRHQYLAKVEELLEKMKVHRIEYIKNTKLD